MSRRCLCSRLFAALRDDPRLATLPFLPRALFLLLADAATRAPSPGVLPFSDTRRVSLLVSCSETEAETGLETLETEGLIRREAGALVVPLIADAATRSEVARRNGSGGGRPRKGETREQYLARRQGEILLPIATGPALKPSETQPVNQAEKPYTSTSEVKSPLEESGSDRARDGFPHVALGIELAALAGMDGARGGFDYRPVQAWLNAGHAPEVIREAVQAVVSRPGYQPGKAWSLKFFDQAVGQAAAEAKARRAMAPAIQTPEQRRAERLAIEAIERRIDATILGPYAMPPRASVAA
jgi:hypothetical protein